MRRRYISIALSLLGLAILTSSCSKHEPDPEFVSGETISLMMDGSTVLKYDAGSWQASWRENKRQYRVFSDDNKSFYKLVCSSKPESEGQTVTASLYWSLADSDAVHSKTKLKMTVERIDPETGAIWLWSTKKNIGVAVLQAE